MFSVDVFNNLEPLSIYLSKPSGKIICCLDKDVNEDDAKITIGLNQQLQLQFTTTNDYTNENTSYDALQEGMYLFVEKIGLFKMKQPSIENDGMKEIKNITAYSCDVELEDKNCTLSLNMGTSVSQEYLVTYDADETESLVNPYTNIPYDWLVIYNTFPEQLGIVANKYSSGYYGSKNASGEIVVRNATLIKELQELLNLIPRLKSKITETTDSNGVKNCTLTEYVIFTYDASGENVTTITLLSNFLARVNTLITFYTKYRNQLSLLSVVLEPTGGSWSIGDIYGVSEGDYSLANRKYQFKSDENIYSFLTHTLAEASNCIISFDILNRKVNMTPVDKIGNDTGIVLSYENLVNMLNVSCNDETLTTRLYVSGGSDLSIRQVNFGLDYIDDITYKLNALDGNGKRIYVSDELAQKYMKFIEYRESQRKNYIQYSKDYRYYDEQITELKYRVPNDSLKTDWGTFSYAELEAALTTYKNLLAALISLYKDDYGTAGVNADGSVKESYIKNTMYWYDYEAYKNTITEIECACHTYPYYSDESKWSSTDIAQYKKAIKAWETEWSLYGTMELQAKIDAYTSDMKILSEQSVILVSSSSDRIKTWNQLTADEKESFGNLESNYFYDIYMSYYNYRESAKSYLNTLQSKIDSYEKAKTTCQNNRTAIVKNTTVSNYFTESECKEINLLYRDSSYTNENILTTSIDSTSKSVDRMYELLEDCQEKLSSLCRPQLTFSVDSDNLLGLVEFKPFWKEFLPGNYILVQYKDNTYIKLRMVGYRFNPLLPSSRDFDITFSNYIRSKTKVSDLEDLLGLSASTGTNGSSGGSDSGVSGTYGESDDIDVTISNTMLAKLLNSESFGTRVTNIILDTVDVNSITARYAKFEGLAKGTTLIDGKCITTGYIIDQTYNGTNGDINNSAGSVVNLETGKFSFAGGKIKFNGTKLSVKGSITADSGYIGGESGFTIAAGKLYSNGHSAYNTAKEGVYIGTDYISLGHGGIIWFRYDGLGKIGVWNLNSVSIWKGNNSWGANGGMYFGQNGLSIGNTFKVNSAGKLEATGVKISGDGAALDISANDSIINANSRITQTANAITAEVTRATEKEGVLSGRITVNENQLSLEVTRAKDAESTLSSRITLNENQILLKVSKGTVSSEISVESGKVYIRGNRLVVDSKNFYLDEEGNSKFSGLIEGAGGTFSGDLSGATVHFYGLFSYNETIKMDGINGHIYCNDITIWQTLYTQYLRVDDIYTHNGYQVSIHSDLSVASNTISCYQLFAGNQVSASYGNFSIITGELSGTSDRRKKTNISDLKEDFTDRLIDGLIPVEYNLKNKTGDRLHCGVIAQDVIGLFNTMGLSDEDFSIVTTLHDYDKQGNLIDSYYGINYIEFIPILVKYCQGLKKSLKEKEIMYNNILQICLSLKSEVNLLKQDLKRRSDIYDKYK